MKRTLSLLLVIIICFTAMPVVSFAVRDVSYEESLAQELKELGLFKGVSDTNFDLSRAPSRVEALVMLIRTLGKENDALNGTWRHPFDDVPKWADKYVGYAYVNSLTNGQSATKFGSGNANAAMFVTFVLRALGYSDTNGEDFVWSDPFTLARQIGILNDKVNLEEFWRSDVVLVAHASLSAYIKGTDTTLAQKLISQGVFTQNKFDLFYNSSSSTETSTQPLKELSAEEIYKTCSPAVFYIEIYDKSQKPIALGSGFFIDDKGTAVTNYHVIEGAYSAKIQLSDNGQTHDIIGVYDYNIQEDWAVIKVDCTGNNYLEIGDNSTVVGAATIYAIGSPLGLQNTISQGIISNPARKDEYATYIQVSAAISPGSSGGALINKYGQVIGITSAGYTNGQNLNLALPMTYVEGFKKSDVKTLELLAENSSYEIPVAKKMAFELISGFVMDNYQNVSESLGYKYSFETEKKDGTGIEEYSVFYDEQDGSVTVSVLDYFWRSHYFAYYFSIYPDSDRVVGSFFFDSYTESSGFVTVAQGNLVFSSGQYSGNSDFKFDSYEGDGQKKDQIIARDLQNKGLDYLNYLFSEYLNENGYYSTQDLGFKNYKISGTNPSLPGKDEKPNITYELSASSVTVTRGKKHYITLDYKTTAFPKNFSVSISSGNSNIAEVDWSDMSDYELPWGIIITGISPGTTYLKVTNTYNNQSITIPIHVK